jgi:hypothetical protein
MHLRGVGGQSVRIRWEGLRELGATCEAPWGSSSSVLEARWSAEGADEIHLQSGDVLRVRAARRTVERDAEPLARRYASLVAGALVDAALFERGRVDEAEEIIAEEILVRRSLGDV